MFYSFEHSLHKYVIVYIKIYQNFPYIVFRCFVKEEKLKIERTPV